ncbi:DUF2853 family protein [Hyphomonas sp.]|uniref:DUF2853 family protein n=1 Tax=Hyphomonas sp. TaxID=87 RepID=UPI00333FC5C3
MADASAHADNIKKHANDYNQAAAEKIVGHLGIALRNRDSAIVSCTDGFELSRIREKWCRGKLGVALNQQQIDAAIEKVCDTMKAEGGQKSRVTFYYLLAQELGKLDHLASR